MILSASLTRYTLKTGLQVIDVKMCNLISIHCSRNLTETLTVMIEEGAVARSGARLLMTAVACTSPSIVRALATAPGVMLDAQASAGWIYMQIDSI